MNKERIKIPRRGSPSSNRGIPQRALKKLRLGELLQTARADSGLSVRQAAAETNISIGNISQIEQGKTQKPSLDTLLVLSELYGIDPMQLIEAAGYKLTPRLPEFQPHLRQKYRHLPKNATDELADAFLRITEKYGTGQHAGPINGEDEDDSETPNHSHHGAD